MKPWTGSYLAFVLPLKPDDVLRTEGQQGGWTARSRNEWRWIQTAQRLVWQYGFQVALAKLNHYVAACVHD